MKIHLHRSHVLMAKVAIEAIGIALSFALAFNLRFDGSVPRIYVQSFYASLPFLLLARFSGLWALTRFRHQWHSVCLDDFWCLAKSTILGSIVFVAFVHFLGRVSIPRSVLLLEFFFTLNLLVAVRVLARMAWKRARPSIGRSRSSRRVLIIGAGDAGGSIVRLIKEDHAANLVPIGFVDDDPVKRNRRIQGIPVLGTVDEVPALVEQRSVEQLLIAIPSLSAERLKQIVEKIAGANVEIAIVPGIPQILDGQRATHLIRKVRVEDLLERTPVHVDLDTIADYLEGQRVLVTGAGGSIGSELCRQIAGFKPESLIVLGQGENSIFYIDQELRTDFGLQPVPVIADIKDRIKLEKVFQAYSPTVVFHAAAHKHVPLMEQNPEEAIKNNVMGTTNVVELSINHGVRKFVMISTDKAVNPTSVMGASKRVAEMVVQSLAQRIAAMRAGDVRGSMVHLNGIHAQNPVTEFASVRFGNVLGSRGSVIPTMQRQIEKGGPVTVTDPEMVRFFMTIPEAVQLVIQAGAMARDGEVFVLDMGKPVKIMDLARNLIRLSGFTPERDIPIKVTGIRPGEKLYEEVLTAEEGTTATTHEKIFMARPCKIRHASLYRGLDRLEYAVRRCDGEMIIEALMELVPTFKPQNRREPAKIDKRPLELQAKALPDVAAADLEDEDISTQVAK